MKCADCEEESEEGDICSRCRLERLRKKLEEQGRIRKSPPGPADLQLPPGDRE